MFIVSKVLPDHLNSVSVFQECVDVDECIDLPDACVSNSVCINTVVSPACLLSKAETDCFKTLNINLESA